MNYLLFVVYFLLFCWLVVRVPFIKKSGIDNRYLWVLFSIKITAGLVLGWISLHYYNAGNDYWDLNTEGWKEYQILLSDPGEYFTNIFKSGYAHGYSGFFDSLQSFWNDLKNNLIIKLVSVFNIFSQGNYYINSLFFNFIIFFGHVALYRVFINIFNRQKIQVITGCFLLPSMIYFTSGIHKDGIVFLFLALLIYLIYFSFKQNRFTVKHILLILISVVILFLMRNFIFLALIPAITAWAVSIKLKKHPLVIFAGVYLVAGLLLFTIKNVFPTLDPLGMIVEKQTVFSNLPHAVTQIELAPLSPDIKSFLVNAPQSVNHFLLRPYLFELPSKILLPMNIELLVFQLLFIGLLFFHKKRETVALEPFLYFALFFTVTVFLFIGYIVPNLGTLVRYRSIYLPLIITPVICKLNWGKLATFLNIKIKNI